MISEAFMANSLYSLCGNVELASNYGTKFMQLKKHRIADIGDFRFLCHINSIIISTPKFMGNRFKCVFEWKLYVVQSSWDKKKLQK